MYVYIYIYIYHIYVCVHTYQKHLGLTAMIYRYIMVQCISLYLHVCMCKAV